MADEIGYAALGIIPSFKDFPDKLRSGLQGEMSRAGLQAGDEFGTGLAAGAEDGADQASDRMRTALKAGLAAAGVAAGALFYKSLENEAGGSALTARLGLNPAEAERAGKAAGDLYGDNFGESMEQVHEGLRLTMQDIDGMRGASEDTLERIGAKALNTANIFDQDLGGVTRAVSQMMRTGLARDADHAFDILTRGFQSGADKSGDLLDTMNEYGTQFRKVGIDGPAAMGLLSQGLQGGARDADLVADAIKEFGIRASEGSDDVRAAYKDLGMDATEAVSSIAAGGDKAAESLDETLDRLRGVEDPVRRNAIAVALFGTQAEDLGAALYALDPSKAVRELGDLKGAANEAGDAFNDNTLARIGTFKRAVEQDLVDFLGNKGIPALEGFWDSAKPLAEELLPLLETAADSLGDVFDTVAPGIERVVKAFNDLPEGAQKAILIGGGTAALAAKVAGVGIPGIGKGSGLGGGDMPIMNTPVGKAVPVWVKNNIPGLGGGGGGAAGGKGKLPLLLGGGAVAAGAAAAYSAPGVFGGIGRGLQDYDETDVPAALAGSNVGKNADKFGIDLQRLAKDLEEYGDKGKYVIEVQKDLEEAGNVGIARGLGEFLSPLVHDGEKARLTLLDLEEAMRESGAEIKDWSVKGASSLDDMMLATLKPTKGIEDFGIAVADLPKGVKVALDTPGMVESERDVKKLRREFELTEREYQLALSLSGVKEAKASIQSLLDLARGVNVQPNSTGPKDFENLLNPAGSGSSSGGGGGGGGGGSRDFDRPRMTPRAGGVNFNGPVTIRPNDYRDFVQGMDKQRRRTSSDGVRISR